MSSQQELFPSLLGKNNEEPILHLNITPQYAFPQ